MVADRLTSAVTEPAAVAAWTGFRVAESRFAAVAALDATLAGIVRRARDPLVAQMRLMWWHDGLSRIAGGVPAGQPVLAALARHDVPPGGLLPLVEGWEELLAEEAPDEAALTRYADGRGAWLAAAAGRSGQGEGARLSAAGAGWVLADLAAHVTDAALAQRAAAMAGDRLATALRVPWPRGTRYLGGLARDAAMALAGQGAPGSPRRAARVLRFALTGR